MAAYANFGYSYPSASQVSTFNIPFVHYACIHMHAYTHTKKDECVSHLPVNQIIARA